MKRIYDPSVKKLSTNAIQRYFEQETFNAQPITDPVLNNFLDEITQKYFVNIGAKLFYLVPQDQDTFYNVIHWLGYQRYPTTSVLKYFLTYASAVKNDLKIDENVADFKAARFRNISSFTLDGELSEIVYYGGAYNNMVGNPEDAKILPRAFTEVLQEARYADFIIYTTTVALGDWYGAIGRDYTFLIFDPMKRAYYVLAISDVD